MKEVTQGLSQAKIAELMGEKTSRVNSVFNGKQKVPEDFLVNFVKVFHLDANWLLLGVGDFPISELTSREAALLSNYRASPEEARRSLETTSALLAERGKDKGVKETG
jgi:transcriptional regulator with XRE-family HTH domain